MSEEYRLADVERELRVSRWTLYRWIQGKKLKAVKLLGGQYRVPAEEVEKLKASKSKLRIR